MDFDTDEQYWIGVANDKTDTAKAFFYRKHVVNERETDIQGRVVTQEIERVRIIVPGDDKSQVDRKVQPEDAERWPDVYRAFKAKERHGVVNGTPIREWPYLTREWVAKLEFLNFHAVEDILNASDSALDKLGPGARDLQKRAGEFLKPAPENEQAWREEKKEMQRQIADLNAKINQMMNTEPVEEPKRRGRPPKTAEAA